MGFDDFVLYLNEFNNVWNKRKINSKISPEHISLFSKENIKYEILLKSYMSTTSKPLLPETV